MISELLSFIEKILKKYNFNDDDIENIRHYMEVDEYEIAFESMVLSCVQHKTPLNEKELERFKVYLKLLNLSEDSVYVLDAENLFYETYNLKYE